MNDAEQSQDQGAIHATDEPTEDAHAGANTEGTDEDGTEKLSEAHAAGVRMLRARYHLGSDCALLMTAAVIATAVGPVALIRNVLGSDLPMSMDVLFCCGPESIAAAAVSGAFQTFRLTQNEKLKWRDAVGSRRLRAEFIEILTALENVEMEVLRLAVPPVTAFPQPDPDEILRRCRDQRTELEARRQSLRQELITRRLDLLPHLIGEDVAWDSLFRVDKLSVDSCLTNLQLDGAGLREALAAKPREIQRIARFLQATRRGSHVTTGPSILLNPVLITVGVVDRDLLARAFHRRDVFEAGFLDGLILEVPPDSSRLKAAAFIDDADEKVWHELVSSLFTARVRGVTKLYTLDTAAFDVGEDFRDWCRKTAADAPAPMRRVVAAWPAILLKLALAFHLGAGKDDDTIGAETVAVAVKLLKSVGTAQLKLMQSVIEERSPDDEVERIVQKLRLLGGRATTRELFRHYSGQDYAVLAPVLERAVSLRRIIRDGTALRLPSDTSADPVASASTCQ